MRGLAINTSNFAAKFAISRKVWTQPINFIAFGFGAGLMPFAPGTFGSVMAIPFYILMAMLPWQLYLAVLLSTFVIGIWVCDKAESSIGMPDYSGIVWDEMVGIWVTLFLVPAHWYWIIAGFVLFRLFDILKPWPISWCNNHIHKGFGIMLDDVLAGAFAAVLLQFIIWLIG